MTEYDNIPDAELTRMVAVEVMGYRHHTGCWFWKRSYETSPSQSRVFKPLTDANDRDMAVEAMRENGFEMMIRWYADDTVYAAVLYGGDIQELALADTTGRAVCVAAIKAVMSAKETK